MRINIARNLLFLSVFLSICTFHQTALAADPYVTSFIATPAYASYGQVTTFSWTIANGAGAYLSLLCPEGVTAKNDNSGTAFACNTQVYISSGAVDSIPLLITNVSGTTKSVSAKLLPVGSNGSILDSATAVAVASVGTSPQPILYFSIATSTQSGATTTISWVAHDIIGVNIIAGCYNNNVKVSYNAKGPALPCGTNLFPSTLPVNIPVDLVFTNLTGSSTTIPLTILPAIADGVYDGTHALKGQIEVGPIISEQQPSITSFLADTSAPISGNVVNFSWTGYNIAGANFLLTCGNNISVATSTDATKNLPCGSIIFSEALTGATSLGLVSKNSGDYLQNASVTIIPKMADGSYDAARGKRIDLVVKPKPALTSTAPTTGPTSSQQTQKPVTASLPATTATGYVFVKTMTRGSNNSDVKALQEYLAKDPLSYPGVLITGYYGEVTEKAVQKFQEKYGIASVGNSGYGTVGPKTLAKLNEVSGNSGSAGAAPATGAASSVPAVSPQTSTIISTTFTRPLEIGSRGDDVTALQQYFAKDPVNYPGVLVTGYFGAITEKALKTFQEINGLAKPGDSGYGFVGPKTRVKLNSLGI